MVVSQNKRRTNGGKTHNSFPAIIRVPLAHTLGAVVAGLLFLGCASAPRKPCEFTITVKVMDTESADKECRRLGVKWRDMGGSIKDTDTVRGCAPAGLIISNGTEANLGHEMAHQAERNCK